MPESLRICWIFQNFRFLGWINCSDGVILRVVGGDFHPQKEVHRCSQHRRTRFNQIKNHMKKKKSGQTQNVDTSHPFTVIYRQASQQTYEQTPINAFPFNLSELPLDRLSTTTCKRHYSKTHKRPPIIDEIRLDFGELSTKEIEIDRKENNLIRNILRWLPWAAGVFSWTGWWKKNTVAGVGRTDNG